MGVSSKRFLVQVLKEGIWFHCRSSQPDGEQLGTFYPPHAIMEQKTGYKHLPLNHSQARALLCPESPRWHMHTTYISWMPPMVGTLLSLSLIHSTSKKAPGIWRFGITSSTSPKQCSGGAGGEGTKRSLLPSVDSGLLSVALVTLGPDTLRLGACRMFSSIWPLPTRCQY